MKLILSTAILFSALGARAENPTDVTPNFGSIVESSSFSTDLRDSSPSGLRDSSPAEMRPSRSPSSESKPTGNSESMKITFPVVKYKLKNGLTVLLHEDHTVPLISYHTWYKVGSRDEAPGITGSAHMLEHMMFKGSKNYPGKSFDKILHANGIVNNAFTTYDYTGFYESLPSSKLEMMMAVEVDRMSSLDLKPEDLTSEREVVKEERRWRIDNNPMGVLMESVMGTAFKKSNYRWPIIGTMTDITNFKIETLREFHDKFYVPNNAILVLAGDFRIAEAKRLIDKYYGPLPARPLPAREYPKEPLQEVQRNSIVRKDVQARSVNVAFKGTPNAHEDMYALDLAASILGNGNSSRLHRRMVYQKQVATSAYAYHSAMQDDGIFAVGLNLKPGIATQENLELVYQEIWKLRNKLVTDQDLANAKTQVMKELVDSLTTDDGKARALAVNEIQTGSYENLFRDLDKYNAVTAEQIKTVANKYLNQTQRSVIVLEPRAKKEAPAAAGAPQGDTAEASTGTNLEATGTVVDSATQASAPSVGSTSGVISQPVVAPTTGTVVDSVKQSTAPAVNKPSSGNLVAPEATEKKE